MAKVIKIKVVYYAHEDGTKGTLCAISENSEPKEAAEFIESQLKNSMMLDDFENANLAEIATNIALKNYAQIGYYEFGVETNDLFLV